MVENALSVVAPDVLTLARPVPKFLLASRQVVQRSAKLQEAFRRSREEKWPASQLALELEEPLQGLLDTDNPQDVVQVALYLADEYQQMGDTMLLIDRDTGKAIARITDADLWQPDPVPREGGGMAVPLPRLRPELEAFLVLWHFEKGREEKLLAEITPTLHQTDLLKQEGDPRLLPVTRAGRAHIVDQLREQLPRLLLMASGPVGAFLNRFELRGNDPPEGHSYEPLLRCTAIARSVSGVMDPKTMNLRFNRLGNLCGVIANSWGREIARTLTVAAREHFTPEPRDYTTLTEEELSNASAWVGGPDMIRAMREELFPKHQFALRGDVLPVEHAPLTALLRKPGMCVGAIVINEESYECKGREIHDRWEVGAKIEYTLWLDWSMIQAFDLTNVPCFATALVAR